MTDTMDTQDRQMERAEDLQTEDGQARDRQEVQGEAAGLPGVQTPISDQADDPDTDLTQEAATEIIVEALEEAQAVEALDPEGGSYRSEAMSPLEGVTQKDFSQLTKKNQQFMVKLDGYLLDQVDPQILAEVYFEMTSTLLAGQASSQTARQIYGIPSEVAQGILDQNLQVEEAGEVLSPSPDWQIALDGGLLLGSLFTFLTGLSMLASQETHTGAYLGLVSMIIAYLGGGLAMLITAKNLPNPDAPKGEKGYPRYFLASVGSMMFWFVCVTLTTALLPVQINPILDPNVYMAIGLATFILRFVLRKALDIQGTVL